LRKVNEDQTLLGFIANLKDIRNDLNARETIGWFDFLLKYVYPNLGVNYGTKDKYKETTAVNCLADKLGLSGIDDFVHDAVGRFSELFSYTISKNACRHLTSSNPQPPVFKSDGGLHEKYIDEWAKNKFSKIGEKSDLEVMLEDIKDNYDRINDSDDKLKRVLASLNPCAMNELLFSGIRCLMSGLSFNESMRILVKKALSTMAGEALEKVIEGLPYDKQEAIRKKVESEFKGMPMPWDVNYKPGSLDKVIDKQANDEVAKNEKLYSDSVAEKSSIEQKMKETKARIEEFDYCLANERDCTKEGRKREQTPTPEVEPLAPLLNFSKILQRGSKGEEVRATQLALRALDYPITADGDFGRKTRDAVKSFQKAANITSDGIVGAGTRAAINQRLSANTAGATPKPSENLFSELLADEMQKETNLSKELMKASKNFDSKKQEVADLEAVISGNREKIEILKIERINVLGQISALQQKILRDAQFLGAGYDDPAELFQRNSTLQALEQRIQLIDLDITQYENSIVVGEEEYLPAAKLEASKAKKQFEDAQFELDSYNELSSGRLIEGFDSSDIIENEIALLKADWFVKKTDLETKLKELEKKSSSNEETLEDLSAYALWKTATPDQKALLTQMEREKFDRAIVQSVSPDDADLIEQGSFGTALGNVQQAIFQAYVEAIMETAELNELITVIDKVPGIKLIGNLLAGLKSCVFKNFIYPPISSFLNTLTFDPCGPGKTRLMLPELQDLPNFNGWNFLSLVKAAFLGALKQVATEILFAILFKLASIVFDITCKTLAAAGRAAVRGVLGDTGWRNAVDDIFCGDEKSEEERERLPELVLTTAAPQLKNVPDSSTRDLAETLSVIGTKSEYIRAITSSPDDQDQNFMKNLATFVAAKHPEFAPLIGTAEGMTNMFGQVSNLLTAEQIAALRDGLDDVADVPLEQSICLTDEELDQWNNDRANALEEAGLDPAIARDFVDRQNDRRKSDLADLAEILAKGPENIIGDAINEAINTDPADPECAVVKQVANLEKLDQVKKFMNKAQDGMFKRLESAFLDDIILWRWPIDPRGWLDSPGILSTILGDKEGYTLNFHYIARNNIFFKIMRFTTFLQYPKHEEFPETVGITFKEALDNITIDTTGQKTKIQIEYDITPEWHWKSNTVLTNNFKERNSNGEMVNTRSFDYKFRQRSRENFVGNFVVERIQSDRLNKWMRSNKLTATESEFILFKKYLKEIFKGFRSIGISHSDANKVLKGLENLCNNKLMSSLLQQDGEMAHGFLHGSKNQEIRAEHLEYVGPKGEEYDYDEDEAVFGKAKVSNSRVKFLDPAEYGGSYTSPNIYISPPKDEGLMSISRVFLPDLKSGCNPKISKTHFLFFEDIKERIDKARQSIPTHKKLSFAPDCVKEIPFDKIALLRLCLSGPTLIWDLTMGSILETLMNYYLSMLSLS
jgi:peptidoglycan hydrolase-like protein with peptidoglycan-binding domain